MSNLLNYVIAFHDERVTMGYDQEVGHALQPRMLDRDLAVIFAGNQQ